MQTAIKQNDTIGTETNDAETPEHRGAQRNPVINNIMSIVADEFGMSVDEMMAPTRDHGVWKPRVAAMYYARLLTDCSLPELGRTFGGRSHTTVLRAYRACRTMMERDDNWAIRMDRLLAVMVDRIVLSKS